MRNGYVQWLVHLENLGVKLACAEISQWIFSFGISLLRMILSIFLCIGIINLIKHLLPLN